MINVYNCFRIIKKTIDLIVIIFCLEIHTLLNRRFGLGYRKIIVIQHLFSLVQTFKMKC